MNRHENKSSTPSQILPYLYQGKAPKLEDFAALASMGIMGVINCTNHINNHFEDMGMVYLRVPLEDSGDSNILEYFDECNRFIEKQKELGSVLVHCAGGICRSSTIVVAYLIASKKLSLKDALDELKKKRAIACVRDEFLIQLISYERSKLGKVSMRVDEPKEKRKARKPRKK